ncbi:hypothetical protein A3B21_00695 [Candidatus Uhrbacteria bacterium RIFCSPLOWO2_01_FULL_47_24]|uniref:Uncharacterized protein n=1 Tax=Candidatus Uhrbacteria bacterium RIFCSPLOWO2_01_FULL_47_24 TaxID=1802401 RepID=A0A1F7UNS6_9BACT|nr:MAG: hypothetical protein A2753_04865 [Candidatus Uhrbacteria bacterium RIFCSPHIGHO2_01_FULL_47_11]OGL67690.1 MAG: hypothetical protein A3D58_04585 [Candidatus Uhrbacteria bacterium RIFCSPHIGHO2_02_FULL_46_47]OGL74873.1 MAG: hypothetical protein A3F52_00350 [Candidatus Uhrbacteria bacterium RIFCSPHIGHO2_12_FULL_47_11]OGL79895.1 MAG: hypothetical protein A3B21_00695 [Candidatus Uhrbacteria bacterium RIFCSPLOWO2_01_FULL_47_24]OGL84115.1 MAG: hypothetical protein A3J03_03490 [Candidatus Uhrbact
MRERLSKASVTEQKPLRPGEQIPISLPTEAEIRKSEERLQGIAKGGTDKKVEGKRERESSPTERIKNLGSMLARNIKGLRMLGPTGRKIGKGLLLAYAFGLAAETGAVWQAKQIHQARIEHRLKYYGSPQTGSVADRFARGEITRDEAIDESLADEGSVKGTSLGFKADNMRREGKGGLESIEIFAADTLNDIGLKWAEMSVRRGETPRWTPDDIVNFRSQVDEQIRITK